MFKEYMEKHVWVPDDWEPEDSYTTEYYWNDMKKKKPTISFGDAIIVFSLLGGIIWAAVTGQWLLFLVLIWLAFVVEV